MGEQDEENPVATRRARPAELFAQRYRLHRLLATGGMGKVYLAEQTPLGRPIALKVMSGIGDNNGRTEEFRRRFLLEASTCAQLNHPNIVTVHDYGQTNRGELYLVMEFLDGRTLGAVLKAEKRISPVRACSILTQVCRALRVAHQASFIHRDLKPSNIMLLNRGEEVDFVKVIDFGLAKAFEKRKDQSDAELTRPGGWLGSPPYMAPEQFRNLEYGPQTDIYSLGVIFYRCLFGVVPFDGPSHVEVMEGHLRKPIPWPREAVDFPELSMIIERCLQKRPASRYNDVDELVTELQSAMNNANVTSADFERSSGSRGGRVIHPSSPSSTPGSAPGQDFGDSGAVSWSRPSLSVAQPYPMASQSYPHNSMVSQFGPTHANHSGGFIQIPSDEVVYVWWFLVMVLGVVLAGLIIVLVQGFGQGV